MKIFKENHGFSMAELMVVITIIAVMTIGAVVGFRGTGDTLVVRQAAGIIEDTIKIAEMEVMNDEYESNEIHFLPEYIAIVSEVEGSSLDLSIGVINELIAGDEGNLVISDKEGNPIGTQPVEIGPIMADFSMGMDLERQYQLSERTETDQTLHEPGRTGDHM